MASIFFVMVEILFQGSSRYQTIKLIPAKVDWKAAFS
jgi:hypothetical protein